MITSSDFIHLPCTRDLTEGGIAYAVRSLPYTYNRMGGSPYDRLRRIVAGVAVELAFRRHLTQTDIPFDVKGATPFTPGTVRILSVTDCQSARRSGGPETVACAVSETSRLRSSPSKPFMTEMMVISAATPRHTPAIEIQEMKETKKPCLRVRT